MSGTFPSTPAPASCELGSFTPTLISAGQSLKRQVRTRGGQRWTAALTWGLWQRSDLAPIHGFVLAQDGQFGTFSWVHPTLTPQGTWAGTPVVDGASQTGSTINLKGFSVGATVKAGDLLKFADSKVYMATANGVADGAGKIAALAIKPKLIVSPADGETVVFSSVPFTMQLASDRAAFPVQVPILYSLSLAFMEAY